MQSLSKIVIQSVTFANGLSETLQAYLKLSKRNGKMLAAKNLRHFASARYMTSLTDLKIGKSLKIDGSLMKNQMAVKRPDSLVKAFHKLKV